MYLIYYYLVTLVCVQGEIISTAQGKLRGEERDGYESYGGIPYARTNVKTKFGHADAAPSWSGIKEYQEIVCSFESEPEDCLQLYVHTPNAPTTRCPVLVWVKSGNGYYNPGKIVQQGVIVVIVNYRTGPLGFLCTNDERIPGNVGVKDVVLALRWVRDNIVAFKGNPHKVVVGGQGFGAATVEAVILSPMSEGLIHGGIMQSGTVLAPWAFNYDAENRTNALIKLLKVKDISAILNISIIDIVAKSKSLDLPYFTFGLCLEKTFKNEERLLSDTPFELMLNRKIRNVPLIVGYNSDEAYIFASHLKRSGILGAIPHLASSPPGDLTFINQDHLATFVAETNNLYFNNNHTVKEVLAYYRDVYYLTHIHRSVLFHSSAGLPVYYYQFSHTSSTGVEDRDIEKFGAAHSDELAYLFPSRERDLSGDDRAVQEHLITLWTNFIKNLDPTSSEHVKWEHLDHRNPRLLDIRKQLEMISYPHTTAIHFWTDIYDKHYYNNYKSNY